MNRKVLLIEPNYKNKYPPMYDTGKATIYEKITFSSVLDEFNLDGDTG